MKRYLMLILVVIMIVSTGCSNRTALTIDEFNDIMIEKGYEIQKTTLIGDDDFDTISNAKTGNYEIAFMTGLSIQQSISGYEDLKEIIQNMPSDSSSEDEVKGGNYYEYSRTTDDDYFILSRIGKTIIFSASDKKYKDTIILQLEELGYK